MCVVCFPLVIILMHSVKQVKTKVVLMEDVLAARAAASGISSAGHFAPADQQQQRKSKAKKITLNV